MKKLTMVGATIAISSTGLATEFQQPLTSKAINLKPGQEGIFVTNKNEQIVISYEDLLQQLKGNDGKKIKHIHIEENPIRLDFLDDLSIDVSIEKQTDSPPNVDPITE